MNDNSLKIRFIQGILWKFFERIGSQLVCFISSIIMARILLPNEFGAFYIISFLVSLFSILILNGVGGALIQKKDIEDDDFNTMLIFSFFFSCFLYLILFVLSPFIAIFYNEPVISCALKILGIVVIINSLYSIQSAYISRKLHFKRAFLVSLPSTIVSYVIAIYMAYSGYGIYSLIFQNLISCGLISFFLCFVSKWNFSLNFSFDRLLSILSFGKYLMVTGFLGIFFNEVRGLVIGGKFSTEELGYYNRGASFPNIVSSNFDGVITSVLFPILSQKQYDSNIILFVKKLISCESYVIFPVFVGLALIAEPLVQVLLTEKWISCVPFFQIFCFQHLIGILNSTNLVIIKSKGAGKLFLQLDIIKKAVILIIFSFTVLFSSKIIAMGAILCEIVALVFNSAATFKLIGYSLYEQMKDAFFSVHLTVIMGIVVFFIGCISVDHIFLLLFQIAGGIVSYVGLSFLTYNKCFFTLLTLLKMRG